jgi:ParB family transcriptional regulator, chromosome partitioning protein
MKKTYLGQENIPIEFIVRGEYQPRRFFDEDYIQELADSIIEQGLIQPIVVRKISESKYELVAGECRWRAHQLAGIGEVRSEIYSMDDETAAKFTIIENLQRKDLNSIEEAEGFSRLIEEFSLSHEELAVELGKSRTYITNALRLLSLDNEVREYIELGQLSAGHGKVLAGVSSSAQQKQIAKLAISRGWSVRKIENAVYRAKNKEPQAHNKKDPNVKFLERKLAEFLASPVDIDHDGTSGEIIISWKDIDTLQGIFMKMGYSEDTPYLR